jgi:hypothetical protein
MEHHSVQFVINVFFSQNLPQIRPLINVRTIIHCTLVGHIGVHDIHGAYTLIPTPLIMFFQWSS